MNTLEPFKQKSPNNFSQLLVFCLLFSLALHLLAILAFMLLGKTEESQFNQQKATMVRLVPPPQKQLRPNDYEIDQRPIIQEKNNKVESFRKADQDQKVVRETAPKGYDVRDLTTNIPLPVQQPRKQKIQQRQERIPKKSQTQKPITNKSITKTIRTKPRPTPAQLQPDQSVLQKIAQGTRANEDRTKERSDTEIGDVVWLNLQSNLLVSFFRRFHNQVELVWNYPVEAAMNGVEGTLELMIIVNRKGELIDVDLRRSSGSDLLDFEAIQAVYRAAPFGQLTKHYPHDVLKIRAHFNYNISGRFIYGRG